jgi:hypothetical protein
MRRRETRKWARETVSSRKIGRENGIRYSGFKSQVESRKEVEEENFGGTKESAYRTKRKGGDALLAIDECRN